MAGSVPTTQVAKHYHNITRNDFPKGFVFGVGTSAYQVEGAAAEGGRGISVWDEFSMKTPDKIFDGSNGNVADDMYHRYKEDIKMMKNMGFDAYRFSISWPRLIPSGKISLGVNREAVDYYNDLIDTVRKHEMECHVTLFHWDLPVLLEKEYRGFLTKEIVDDYCDYVDLCFWEFGDRVKHWATFNEPWSYCYHGYVGRIFPPGIKVVYETAAPTRTSPVAKKARLTNDHDEAPLTLHNYRSSNNRNPPPPTTVHVQYNPVSLGRTDLVMKSTRKSSPEREEMSEQDKEAFIAAKHMILAHAAAVELYKTKFKEQRGQIGIVLNNTCFEPLPNRHPAHRDREAAAHRDREAAKRVHDFKFGWFLEPILTGEYPISMRQYIPREAIFSKDEKDLLTKHKIDFLGLNYYTAKYVQYDPNPDPKLATFDKYQCAKVLGKDDEPLIGTVSHLDWLIIVPWGIKKLLEKINEYYNNRTYKIPPIYITENGVAQPKMPPPGKSFHYLLEDTERVDYYQDHLGNLLDVINEWKSPKGQNKLEIKVSLHGHG